MKQQFPSKCPTASADALNLVIRDINSHEITH